MANEKTTASQLSVGCFRSWHFSVMTTAVPTTSSMSSSSSPIAWPRRLLLVEFAVQHLDFQQAELESVLRTFGYQIVHGNQPSSNTSDNSTTATALTDNKNGSVLYQLDLPEPKRSERRRRPFALLLVPPEIDKEDNVETIASIILSRSTLVRSVLEVWGLSPGITKGSNASLYDQCVESTQDWMNSNPTIVTKCRQQDATWKLTIHTLGCTYNRQQQEVMRQPLVRILNLPGPVKMKQPTHEFVLIREGMLNEPRSTTASSSTSLSQSSTTSSVPDDAIIPPGAEEDALSYYFGRSLCGPRAIKGRADLKTFTLKNRAYLGPTSMDAELSLVLANLACIKQGTCVLDPFVGTGSILLACAVKGAHCCLGTDIDVRVLRGKGNNKTVFANFVQFGLPRPELVRSDNALYHRHFRTNVPLYDAIVCDPPYGIRAGARKSGSRKDNPRPVLDEHRHDHIAQTRYVYASFGVTFAFATGKFRLLSDLLDSHLLCHFFRPYSVADVMSDLLDVAARTLVMGGRLVYIIPSFSNNFDPNDDLPHHECLRIVHICFQPLSTADLGRRVVAMEKVAEYNVDRRDEYRKAIWKNGAESAEKCANIRERILEAARKKPGYEEKAAYRKEKRKQTREARRRAKLQKLGTNSEGTR